MPIYEYKCSDCNAEFSRLQSVNASADGVRCPACQSDQVVRQISSFASSTSDTGGAGAGPAHSCGSGFS
jgi:putative FmdB family regulatory protein